MLWELWRRLPPDSFTVYTTPHKAASEFDREQDHRVLRSTEPVLLPYPWLARRINRLAAEVDAELVLLDPALPLGAVARGLDLPYGLILHGAEITVPGRLPGLTRLLGSILGEASIVISAGDYALSEAERAAGRRLRSVVIPPGVDTARFRPLTQTERDTTRLRYGLPTDRLLVHGQSRLVPRKGLDTLIRAAARVGSGVEPFSLAIGGAGRDRYRLELIAASEGVDVRFLGRVPEGDLPLVYGSADVFGALCRRRWGGLEQEGFGIVFLEAAACGVPQIAGLSGGSAEAVSQPDTGFVVDPANDVERTAQLLGDVLGDEALRRKMGEASRTWAEGFDYDVLAARLGDALS